MPEWSDTALILSARSPRGKCCRYFCAVGQRDVRQGWCAAGNPVPCGCAATRQYGQHHLAGRLEEHLGAMTAELVTANAALIMDDTLRLAGLTSICAIIEGCLPEREPCPGVHDATATLISMISEDEPEIWLAGLSAGKSPCWRSPDMPLI